MAKSKSASKTTVVGSRQQDYTDANDGSTGTLTTVIEVQESAYRCGVFVEAKFSLKMEDDKQARKIGHLYSYRINTKAKDENGKSLFLSEVLTTAGDERLEVEKVMQTIFTKAGNVRAGFKAHRAELDGDSLMFIDTLQLNEKYHGKGLAQLALSSFHDLLPTLTDPYAFSGTILLSPAASGDYKKKNGKSDVEIENALIRSYEKSDYEVWLKGKEDVEGSITVMGRTI